MATLMVEGDFVLTMDKDRAVIKNGAVYVENDKIVAVGEASELKSKYKADQILGGERKLVMPGFIDTHDHTSIALSRSFDVDLPSDDYIAARMVASSFLDEYGYYAQSKLCFLEMIKSGITTVMDDSYPYMPKTVNREKALDGMIRAASEVGVKAIETVGGIDSPGEKGWIFPAKFFHDINVVKRDAVNMIRRYNVPDSKIRIWASLPLLFCTTPNMIEMMKQITEEYNTSLMAHANEEESEVVGMLRKIGKRTVEYLYDLGILSPKCLLAHATLVTDKELGYIQRTDAKVAHNPYCNAYWAMGVAPVPKMLKMGITVGLGTDDGGYNNEDFFTVMKTCAILHKVNLMDPCVMPAEKVLEMATIDGARALGMSDTIGSLESRKKADIIIIDLNKPNSTPRLRPVQNLIHSANATDVDTTIIDGEIVMENREVKMVDEPQVLEDAEKAAWKLVTKGKSERWVTRSSVGWKIPRP